MPLLSPEVPIQLIEAAETPTSLAADVEDLLYRKVILRIAPLFFLGFVISYLDRVNISLAKLDMAADFGLTDTTFAIGASIFFWGYMLCEVPSNLILQRVGARAWIARIMITWGLVSMLMVFSSRPATFYSLRLLLGICEAGFVPGVFFYIGLWLPSRRQSGMYALFLMALPISIVFGAPLSGAILRWMQGVAGLRGWQWLFILEALPAVVLGFVILLLLRNTPRDAPWLTGAEKQILEANVSREATSKAHRFADAIKSPRLYVLILVMLLFNTGFYGLSFWMPTLVRNAGVADNFHVGLYTAIPFAIAAVAMRWNASSAERSGRQRLHGTVAVSIGAIGLLLATSIHWGLPFLLVTLTLAASGILSLMPIFWALPGRILTGSAAAGGLALINSCGNLSGVLGTLLIGLLGMQRGMFVLTAMLFLCAPVFYGVYTSAPTPNDLVK